MSEQEPRITSGRTAVALAGGILLALGLAFLLSRLDVLQRRQVVPGETLEIIDLAATVSAGDVTMVNISDDVGIELITPLPQGTRTPEGTGAPTAVPVFLPTCAAAPPGWTLYTVREGDTLPLLSLRFNITIDAIRRANCLNEVEEVVAGQRLFIDQGEAMPTAAATETTACPAPEGWTAYTLEAGDTLAELALARNTTASFIDRINCLDGQPLVPGRVIYLPPAIPPTSSPPPAQGRQPTGGTRPAASATPWPQPVPATARPTLLPSATRPLVTATRLSTVTATSAADPNTAPTQTPTAIPATLPATSTATRIQEPAPPASATFTATPAATQTATSLPSVTPSPTLLPSATATHTPSPQPPATATPSPAYPPPPTPTATATPTPTHTPTPTATPTPAPYPYP